MIAIELKFPTGKLHATPWGRHVNEGAVEWPPSPWRFLRAFLAVWHHKFHDVSEEEMRALIAALSETPSFQLPTTSHGHTRHYMPAEHDKKTKIFDTFIALSPDDPLVISWPAAELDDSQQALLTKLLEALSYFGRAESWVIAKLLKDYDGPLNAVPLNGHGVQKNQELVRLLAPTSESEHEQWREKMLADMQQRALQEKQEKERKKEEQGKKFTPIEKVKLTPKDLQKLEATLPETVFDALHAETNDLRKAGWNRPPASEWIDYVCNKQTAKFSKRKRSVKKESRPTVARYAVASAVSPKLTQALRIGERSRSFVMGCSKKQNGGDCSQVFSGKSQDGVPHKSEQSAHGHAHYLCESNGKRSQGRITHLTIYAPDGFSEIDEIALSNFNHTWGDGGHNLQFVLLGVGDSSDFGGLDEQKGQCPILDSSTTWVSRTPFVPTDHLRIRNSEKTTPDGYAKALQRELELVLRKEISRRPWLKEHSDEVKIEIIPHTLLGGTATTWLKFNRDRKNGGGTRSTNLAYGFHLTFPKPVQGPIILGYGCHFGLGQFVAENL